MSSHKFILEWHNNTSTATLWYSKDGQLYPVRRYTTEDLQTEGFDLRVAEEADEWRRTHL